MKPHLDQLMQEVVLPEYKPGKCQVCGTGFSSGSKKPLCSHVRWSAKLKCFLQRDVRRSENVQAQKYALVPAWRTKRRGHKGEMK